MLHLVHCVHVSKVVLATELVDVPLQVLLRHPVVRAVDRSLEAGPKGFHAVDVDLFVYVFADAVLDGPVIVDEVQSSVCTVFVGVQHGTELHVVHDEPLQGFGIGFVYDFGPNLSSLPVLCADNDGLANAAAPCPEFLVGVFVGLFPANVRLIYFNLRIKHLCNRRRERFADPVEHVPSVLVGDPNVPMQLHCRNALETGNLQVDGPDPFLQG